MTNHVKAFTYAPKIPGVLRGDIFQTIRPVRLNVKRYRPVCRGDKILFHGWAGKPYRSPWSWRIRVTVTNVTPVSMTWHGVYFYKWLAYGWKSPYVDTVAKLDGFEDWRGMRHYFGPHMRDNGYFHGLIIRWDTSTIEYIEPPGIDAAGHLIGAFVHGAEAHGITAWKLNPMVRGYIENRPGV